MSKKRGSKVSEDGLFWWWGKSKIFAAGFELVTLGFASHCLAYLATRILVFKCNKNDLSHEKIEFIKLQLWNLHKTKERELLGACENLVMVSQPVFALLTFDHSHRWKSLTLLAFYLCFQVYKHSAIQIAHKSTSRRTNIFRNFDTFI